MTLSLVLLSTTFPIVFFGIFAIYRGQTAAARIRARYSSRRG
jgi:hypothetical protein